MLLVSVHPRAQKELIDIPKKVRLLITAEIDALGKLSHPGQHRHVKKLEGRDDRYRLRVGNYRVKMELLSDNILRIYEIKHRQAGY